MVRYTQPITSQTWNEIRDLWEKMIQGGTITCATPGAAINLRQRMYRYRQMLNQQHGMSPYDVMMIGLEPGGTTLKIKEWSSQVVSVISYEEQRKEAERKEAEETERKENARHIPTGDDPPF